MQTWPTNGSYYGGVKGKFLSALRAVLAGLLVLTFVVGAVTPTVAFADYKSKLTNCGGGNYVPKGTACPDSSDWLFFGCMVIVIVGALAAAAAVAWIPFVGGPMALAVFGGIFVAGAGLCPHSSSPAPPPPPPLVASLVPQGIIRSGSLVAGQIQSFSSSIKNTGGSASLAGGNSRFCIDNASCATTTTGSLGNISIPSIAASVLFAATPQTWVATAGSHTVHFCIEGGSCSSLAFVVSAALPGTCTLGTLTWNNGTNHPFYNTSTVPVGQQCDTGVNGSGQPYAKSLLCTNGVISGDLTGTYTNANCSTQVVVQSGITFAAQNELVRRGDSTMLIWDGGNSTACTIFGTNGFPLTNELPAGSISSGIIDQKTQFTLTCTLGVQTQTKTITIDLVPVVKEI